MNFDEYRLMRSVEDSHWWYQGLRTLVWQMWGEAKDKIPGPLLDVGCGTGGALSGAPCSAFGIDYSPEALRLCRERGLRGICRGDAAALPYRDSTFGGLLMLDVLYHQAIADPAHALREARRVLRPGGLLVVNVPAYNWLRSSHDTAIHTARRFTRPRLRALLESAGLRVERLTYWNTVLFPVAAGVRLLRRSSSRHGSDLTNGRPTVSTRVFDAALAVERAALRHMNLPFGLSVLAVARVPSEHEARRTRA